MARKSRRGETIKRVINNTGIVDRYRKGMWLINRPGIKTVARCSRRGEVDRKMRHIDSLWLEILEGMRVLKG